MSEQKQWKRGKFYTIDDEIMGKPAQFRAATAEDLEPTPADDVDPDTVEKD